MARMKAMWSAKALAAGLVLLAAGAHCPAAVVNAGAPAMDIYMYANAFNRGGRGDAGTFGGPIGAEGAGSEDRLAQALFAWNTAQAGILTGLGAENYAITRVTVRFNQIDSSVFTYDPSYDSYRSYLPPDDPDYLPDVDEGRPMELYGVGLRNGYTELAISGSISGTRYGEGSPYGAGGGEHTRHAYAWSPASPRADGDVSENVTERFEAGAFAVGTTEEVAPGDFVPGDTSITFELNLGNAGVLDYLQEALNAGHLGFALSSLHNTTFNGTGGDGGFPRYSTRETAVPFLAPQLEIEYTVIPEPGAANMFILGAALLAGARAWRRRDYYS